MRISVISGNTYVYRETIKKIEEPSSASSPKSTTKAVEDNSSSEEFGKLLKEIQDKLQKATDKSLTSIGTSVVGSTNVSSRANGVDVNSTSPDYVSIAPESLQAIYKKASETYGIDQKLMELIGYHESRFQADATSRTGAMGIMQLMPETASDMGVDDAYDPEQNIMGAGRLLRQLSDTYSGDLDLILAGYSAGMGAVRRHGGIPPYEETLNYIEWIHERYP